MNYKKIVIFLFLTVCITLLPSCTATSSETDEEKESATYTEAHIEEIKNINTDFIKSNYPDYYEETINNLSEYQNMYNKVIDEVNEYRTENNLSPVTLNADLTVISSIRAEEVLIKHSHERPNGNYFSSLHKEYGWTEGKVSENIAWGYHSVDEVIQAWKNSDSHNRNMLTDTWEYIGVGIAKADDGTFAFVQEFSESNITAASAN